MRVTCVGVAVLAIGLLACDGAGSGLIGIGVGVGNGGGTGNPASDTVDVVNFAFSPATATVRSGGTVTWTWKSDTTSHNVTFGNGTISSRTRSSGSHSVQFVAAGTFPYTCTLHAGMNGVVIVP